MIEVIGKYNKAIIYSNQYDNEAYRQILSICNLAAFSDANIRIMPDYHAGTGCVIGFTAKHPNSLIPNIIGVDIGCGVTAIKLDQKINLIQLDDFIKNYIPHGYDVNEKIVEEFSIEQLHCYDELNNIDKLRKSLGSLGGGNHFIEVDEDKEGNHWLVVHTGSRNLGKQVATIYQKKAKKDIKNIHEENIRKMLQAISPQERENWLRNYKRTVKVVAGLEYLSDKNMILYLEDLKICQLFAEKNRLRILFNITKNFSVVHTDMIQSIHNYYSQFDDTIRKGAISATTGQKMIIPMNMRDGCLICIGKGNKEWNFSAPHGAGRLLSRSQAKEQISFEEYEKSMRGIYSTSVNTSTIDESPMAYKPMGEIMEQIAPTVKIQEIIRPIYNFKSSI